jgi:hypothetical protein
MHEWGKLNRMGVARRWQVGRQPILILGHGRSGTSWVGQIISAARRVLYYFEPMHPRALGSRELSNWFRYARPEDRDEALERVFDPVFAGLPTPSKAWNRGGWHRWVPGYRIAVKDVASLMAAEWLYERYQPQMVLIVRHPCPVILSELKQGVSGKESLATLLDSSDLVSDHLRSYVSFLKQATGEIEQLGAVWAARHRVIANALEKNPQWRIVYYEALCADPERQFEELIRALGLRWSRTMAAYVEWHSSGDATGMYSTRRVSRRRIDSWMERMSTHDVERVRRIVSTLSIPFYQERTDWTLARFLQ